LCITARKSDTLDFKGTRALNLRTEMTTAGREADLNRKRGTMLFIHKICKSIARNYKVAQQRLYFPLYFVTYNRITQSETNT
jgi:hypothetical protein